MTAGGAVAEALSASLFGQHFWDRLAGGLVGSVCVADGGVEVGPLPELVLGPNEVTDGAEAAGEVGGLPSQSLQVPREPHHEAFAVAIRQNDHPQDVADVAGADGVKATSRSRMRKRR